MDYDSMMEKAINNMMKVIEKDKELYDWFINYEPDNKNGYIYSSNDNLDKISKLVDSDGHSGASFSICLRMCKERFKEQRNN